MNEITDLYRRGWETVQKDMGGWVIYYLVFSLVSGLTGGIGGLLLLGNVLRSTRDAIHANRAPEVSELFSFDKVGDDLPGFALFFLAIFAGSFIPVIGTIAAVVLFAWVPYLTIDRRFQPFELWKITTKSAADDWQQVLVFNLIPGLMALASLCLCGLPMLLAAPVIGVAGWLFYEQNRDRLFAIGERESVPLLNGPSNQ